MHSRNVEIEVRLKSTTKTMIREFGSSLAQLRKDLGLDYTKFSFHWSPSDPKITRTEEKSILVQDMEFIYFTQDEKNEKRTKSGLEQHPLENLGFESDSTEVESDSEEQKAFESLKTTFSKNFQEDFVENFIERLKANDKQAKYKITHEIRLIKKYVSINEEDLTFQVKSLSGSDVDSSPSRPNRRSKLMSKRDNTDFVYRGQEYADEDIHKPIRARGTKTSITISGHISNYTENSPYLSLTKDLDVATYYAMTYASKSDKKSAKIFVIDKARLLSSKQHFDIRNSNHFNGEFRPKLLRKLQDPEKNQGFSFRAILNGSKDKEVLVKPENDARAEIPAEMILKMYIVEEVTQEVAEFNFNVASATEEEFEKIKSKLLVEKKESELKQVVKNLEEIRAGTVFSKNYIYDKKKWEKYIGIEYNKLSKATQKSPRQTLLSKYFVYRIVESIIPPPIQADSEVITQINGALKQDNTEKLQGLVEKVPLDLEVSANRKWTSIHFAVYYNAKSCLNLMLNIMESKEELKYLIDSRTEDEEWTPLMISAMFNHEEILSRLVSGGADKSLKDKHGRNAFELARRYEASECQKILEENKKVA